MDKSSQKEYSSAFKAKVALEAIRGKSSLPEIAEKYGVPQDLASQWADDLSANAAAAFGKKDPKEEELLLLRAKEKELEDKLDFAKSAYKKLGAKPPIDD